MELLLDEGHGDEDDDGACLVVYDGSTVCIPRIVDLMRRAPLHDCRSGKWQPEFKLSNKALPLF
jgi:hypothetical protein